MRRWNINIHTTKIAITTILLTISPIRFAIASVHLLGFDYYKNKYIGSTGYALQYGIGAYKSCALKHKTTKYYIVNIYNKSDLEYLTYNITNSDHMKALVVKSNDYNNPILNINRCFSDTILEPAVDCDNLISNINYNNACCCENNDLKCRLEQLRNLADKYSDG